MTIENSIFDQVEFRRARVADLRLRGLTLHEIANTLAESGVFNRETGKAFSHETIRKDLVILKSRWRKDADESTDEHLSRQIAELNQIKRSAWSRGNAELALRALNLEAKLLGTFAPTKIEFSGKLTIEFFQRLVNELEEAGLNPESVFDRMLMRVRHAKSKPSLN